MSSIETAEQYALLIEHASDIITLVDAEGVIRFQSPAIERVLGYDTEELVGDPVFEYIHPEDTGGLRDLLAEVSDSPGHVVEGVEYRFRHADGSWIWLESTGTNRLGSSLDGFVVTSRDVTDRKERERELERQADRLEAFGVAFPDMAFIIGEDGEYLAYLAGDQTEDLLYEDPAEFIGDSIHDVFPQAQADEFLAVIRSALETGELQRFEYAIEFDDGEQFREGRVGPLSVPVDGHRAVVWVARDVTDRRENEERLETVTEELEALNRVVRHDIRNDMTVILGWAHLLRDHVDEEGGEILDRIIDGGGRVVDLTESVRDYVETLTGGEAARLAPVDLEPVLTSEIALRRESYPDATFAVEGEIPRVRVHANELLGSVFRNLLNNAVQHNDADDPRVEVSCEVLDDAVAVRVADNGPGIPDDRKVEVFGKGSKSIESAGTGIGLYLVRTLVEQYDGAVRVEDNDPAGAVFVVELPLAGP